MDRIAPSAWLEAKIAEVLPAGIGREVRRRTKVIGRFPGETRCLSLCWAVLDLVVVADRGLGLTDLERHDLAALLAQREQGHTPPRMTGTSQKGPGSPPAFLLRLG